MKLQGIFPPLTTPFHADGSLALDRLRDNVKKYEATGIAGYVATGSTGESVLLQRRETEEVWATIAEAAGPEKILIAGTGTDSTAETIDRTKRAAELAYHFALVKTPYYYKNQMTPDAWAEHFLRVAQASPIPLLIYNVPPFTGVSVEAPLVARLAQHENIAGIKESSGVVQRVEEIIAAVPHGFQTLVGSGTTFAAAMSMGAVGGILAIADVFPALCVELYEAARAGDAPRARALQYRLLEPTRTLVSRLGIPALKYAMECVGFYGGPARAPFLPLTEAQKREVDALVAATAPALARGS